MQRNSYSVWVWPNPKKLNAKRIALGFGTLTEAMSWAQHLNIAFIVTDEDEDGNLKVVHTQN